MSEKCQQVTFETKEAAENSRHRTERVVGRRLSQFGFSVHGFALAI